MLMRVRRDEKLIYRSEDFHFRFWEAKRDSSRGYLFLIGKRFEMLLRKEEVFETTFPTRRRGTSGN